MFMLPKPIHLLEIINLIIALTFDGLMFYFFGTKTALYFILSTFLGLSIHPISGHFIAEHYVFNEGYETYSYYGPLNAITYNVGYHNERKIINNLHSIRYEFFSDHDFPYIPGRNLPKVRQIAPEYYNHLPSYTRYEFHRMKEFIFSFYSSWTKVMYNFVMNDNVGPWARINRSTKIGRVPVVSQQEYEQQLKAIVKEADKSN